MAVLTASALAHARKHVPGLGFKYVGGTEDVGWNCEGRVQLSGESLTFRCGERELAIPYASITLMQYRPDVSAKVREMNLNWKVRPPHGRGKKNRYFSVVYSRDGNTHAVILEAGPDVMRPYLAEIDLKSGKRVEVRGYENYE
jgi:hypothetical protein